jgi:aspartyl-tRNA(Asn)/glutamyl-tRNA(Gln) amidotransferase subunit A
MTSLPTTIDQAAQWLRSGRITAVVLTEELLARSHATQDTLAAFIEIVDRPAIEAARQADADFAAGIDRGPLQGIPLAVKDIIATRDAPTTANSNVLDRAWGDRDDATVVRKLRAAGAVITGKLGLNEYAIGAPDPATGFRIPKNPWNLEHTPGGSSSGTGAAIAGGLILGGLGTDTGGSIRGPASYCGIGGLKATFGRVSKEGCVPLGYSLDNIGPMARTARDCALLLQVLAGYDPLDPSSADMPVPDYLAALDGSVAGLRIGVPRRYYFDADGLDPAVRDAALAAIDDLVRAGASIVDVDIPHAEAGTAARQVISRGEAYAYHEPDLQERPELYGRYTRGMLILGAFFTSGDFVQAQRVRSVVKAETEAALAGVDVMITPTSLDVAPKLTQPRSDGMLTRASFTALGNLVGIPALSIPCGFKDGLPIGLQIMGKPFDESTVFKVADAYQRMTDWHERAPATAELVETR